MPWTGLNQFVARLDGPTEADAADLSVRGTNATNYPVVGYAYDPATFTARWTLAGAVDVDKVVFTLDGHSAAGVRGPGVAPGSGPLMDGEDKRAGSTPYPTGDGVAGGDFHARLNVLPGNALSDARVDAQDMTLVKRNLNRVASVPGGGPNQYSIYADIIPDGRINAQDLTATRRHLNRQLPAGEPGALVVTSLAPTREPPLLLQSPAGRFFGDAPIL